MNATVQDNPIFDQEINLIKRNGEKQKVDQEKFIKWGVFGRDFVKDRKVDWVRIMRAALGRIVDGMTTDEVHSILIQETLEGGDDAHNRMAGVLYAPQLHKRTFGDEIPTVYNLQKKLRQLGLMKNLSYTKAEYDQIEKIIDHRNDYKYAHFQLVQMTKKYAIQDRVSSIIYETPQFTFMRVAMTVFSTASKVGRIDHIREFYELLHKNVINAPSPNYIFLGTPHSGLMSCCLIHSGDTLGSINAADNINFKMTAIGAGIGEFMGMRQIGDPVRAGSFSHNGKQPYAAVTGKVTRANMQAGRAGAVKIEVNIFDAEAGIIAQMQNPRTPQARRNRDLHVAIQHHRLFLLKMIANEDVFTFSTYTAPDLFEAFYGSDPLEFERLYNKYEQDPNFKKNYVNARDLFLLVARETNSVGTVYGFFTTNVNTNTPFKEKIYCSNLCVSGDTLLMTSKGELPIGPLAGKTVSIWNGKRWSEVKVCKTGENQKLLTVSFNDNKPINATPYHKWYIKDKKTDKVVEVRTHELKEGDIIAEYTKPVFKDNDIIGYRDISSMVVKSVMDTGLCDDTFCVTEPYEHKAMFNGILTGQCMEILQPTYPYDSVEDLFENDYVGDIIFTDNEGIPYTKAQKLTFVVKGDESGKIYKYADLVEGMTIRTANTHEAWITVKEITYQRRQPETSLCALGGVVVYNVENDEMYYKAMYYTQRMIAYCIENSNYPYPQIAFTAKERRNAGIGLLGAATVMAQKNLRYDSKEGLEEIHRMAERHYYFAIKASIAMGKEFGNAPWINKTKFPDGWLPIDTYSRYVDTYCNPGYVYDWEEIRAMLIANGGMYFSILVAHMPTESSSKAAGSPNGWYPIRELQIGKTDATTMIEWSAPWSDTIGSQYQLAFNISPISAIRFYGVIQKFTDGGISADIWKDISEARTHSAVELINESLEMARCGLKTHYYYNFKTEGLITGGITGKACGSGGCSL